jgi:hypothetical protein
MVLTVADIERWNAEAVREVFHAATARGNATLEASRQLSTLAVFDTWEGLTAEARKHTNASIRQDLDDHGNESLTVGRAAGKAADDIEHVQSELRTLRHDAAELHMAIDSLTNKIIPTKDALQAEAVVAEIQLQPRLDTILAEANAVDAELAAAINMAEGNAPAPTSAQSGSSGTRGTNSAMPPASTQPQRPNNQAVGDPAATAGAAQGRPDPTDTHYTRSPLTDPIVAADPSVVARQAGKVADARRALDAAQAKLDAAAKQAYTHGPGSGPDRRVTDPLSQAVFDARRTLTEQSAILDDLNKSAAATDAAQPIPTPPPPPNAGVQAFPPEPSVASQAARGLTDASHDISKATFGVIPDVAKDIHTFTNWSDAASGDRTDALLDSASLIPGGKLLGEAHHGLGALADAARHADDIPNPHMDVPTPHADVPSPIDHHVDVPGTGGDMPHIDVNMKDGWSDFQQSQMQDKVEQFNNAVGDHGFTQTPPAVRDPGIRQDFLDSLGLDRVPPGFHVDHTRDLQAGGTDTLDNMGLLDGSVNSSFGSQLNKGMNQFPLGTVFGGVRLPEP